VTEGAEQVRHDVRAWLASAWDPDLALAEWRERLVESGWGAPTWPRRWFGRDLPEDAAGVVRDEMERAGAVGLAAGVGMLLAAPTLLAHGSERLLDRLLRPTMTGAVRWCQLFSEPGAGSDLAGLATRAVRDGDGWVVNGQKVWTTGAHVADYGLLLARTDVDAPKHRGITYLVLDMHQPGVEVRPLRQMNGHRSFNEVFLSDARVPADDVIGEVNGGWPVAVTTLAHERRRADFHAAVPSGRAGRAVREAAAEAAAAAAPYTWYPQRAGRVDLVMQRARETGKINDPVVRQEIAKLLIMAKSAEWTARRARAAQEQGKPQGPEGSLGKLVASNVARQAARVHTYITGADALLSGGDSPMGGVIAEVLVSVPASSIAGGTDEIQRNIISERVLKMPRETSVDTNKPFKDVPRNVVAPR
jgi:alkylation response protein AidB-like acyl-CoA dehydrogenase